MGEAKRRKMRREGDHARLNAEFLDAGVDPTQFAFYDQPAFLAREGADPTYLEKYAQWVATRPRDVTYESHVKEVVPRLATLLAQAFVEDDLQGGCVAAGAMLTRILDRLGVWSFGVLGSANFSVDGTDLHRSLQHCDFQDFQGAELGHSWVVAPPYYLVDASIALQRWGDDPIREHIPLVLLKDGEPKLIRAAVDDVVSARMRLYYAQREGRADSQLHHRLAPTMKEFSSKFPAFEVTEGRLRARYVPMGIRQSDCGLEEVNSEGSAGRSGATLWREVIAPAFSVDT